MYMHTHNTCAYNHTYKTHLIMYPYIHIPICMYKSIVREKKRETQLLLLSSLSPLLLSYYYYHYYYYYYEAQEVLTKTPCFIRHNFLKFLVICEKFSFQPIYGFCTSYRVKKFIYINIIPE